MAVLDDALGRAGSLRIVGAVALACALTASACSGGSDEAGSGDDRAGAGSAAQEGADPALIESDPPVFEAGTVVAPALDGPSAEMITLQEDPFVGALLYPRPEYEANPWSQWGQGVTLDDGRVISAIGDHLGVDGNSYLFVYDPETATMTRIADVLGALDHTEGSWGYGKVHSQMVDPGDGGIWFATYYGTTRELEFDDSYQGDVLFRLDTETLELQPVTVPVPLHGIPTLAANDRGLIFGEAVDPLLPEEVYPEGGFFVYDVTDPTAATFDEDERLDVFRNVLVDEAGAAWFAGESGSLFRYDPETGETELTEVDLGQVGLRASTSPAADGTVYGVTEEPWEFFAFRPDGTVDPLGSATEYATSLALTPDQQSFLYVPGAHGDAHLQGAPLIAVSVEDGEQTTLVELRDLVEDEFGLLLGGTYNITVDAERNLAYIGFNAGTDGEQPWGEVLLVAVELP